LLLVGNGTGIAGLRALLKARVAAGARRNWLLMGERQRAHVAFFETELRRWLDVKVFEDTAFSSFLSSIGCSSMISSVFSDVSGLCFFSFPQEVIINKEKIPNANN